MPQGDCTQSHWTTHPARRLTRLPSYDYTQEGAYFITVCTFDRMCLFGEVVDDIVHPNQFGQAVLDTWSQLPNHYVHVQTCAFVLMPNHVHGVLVIQPTEGQSPDQNLRHNCRHGLLEVVRAFKTFSARGINGVRGTRGQPVWQRGYYEHVVRSEKSLERVCEYVANNPLQWTLDRDNPGNWREGLKPSPTQRGPGIAGLT